LVLVRNCTSRHRSHLTTSRESTGARVVAIRIFEDARAGIYPGKLSRASASRASRPPGREDGSWPNLRYALGRCQHNSWVKPGMAPKGQGRNRYVDRRKRGEGHARAADEPRFTLLRPLPTVGSTRPQPAQRAVENGPARKGWVSESEWPSPLGATLFKRNPERSEGPRYDHS
jgi:hypothetical protein